MAKRKPTEINSKKDWQSISIGTEKDDFNGVTVNVFRTLVFASDYYEGLKV